MSTPTPMHVAAVWHLRPLLTALSGLRAALRVKAVAFRSPLKGCDRAPKVSSQKSNGLQPPLGGPSR
jgi:hypothetical protein